MGSKSVRDSCDVLQGMIQIIVATSKLVRSSKKLSKCF